MDTQQEGTVQEVAAESFEELIAGRYREDFAKKLRSVLARELKAQGDYLAYQKLLLQAERIKGDYPDFDLHRELENRDYARLIRSGVDLKTAFEAVHHRELMEQAAAKSAEALAKLAQRPVENGLGSGSVPTVYQSDPKSLSAEERRQIKRRARRGEKIFW